MVLRSPVVHQEVPGVLHTVVQLLICCGLPWELLGGPEEPKGGVLATGQSLAANRAPMESLSCQ